MRLCAFCLSRAQTGETPLILAVEFGNADCARLLIEAGADVNLCDKGTMTPLHVAARHGRSYYKACTKLLIKAGANLEARYKGRTPLHEACLRGNAGQAELLLEAGADINSQELHSKMTPLHCAVMAEEGEECTRLLLLHHADPNELDGSQTRTVLSLARHRGASSRTMELLLAGGVDISRDSLRPPQDPRFVNHRALATLEAFARLTPDMQEVQRIRLQRKWKLQWRRRYRRSIILWWHAARLAISADVPNEPTRSAIKDAPDRDDDRDRDD